MIHRELCELPRRHFSRRKGLCRLMDILLIYTLVSALFAAAVLGTMYPRQEGTSPLQLSYAEVDRARYPREIFYFFSLGNRLQGYYYPTPDPRGLIVVAGGLGDGADAHLPEILCFADHGWSVVAFDPTGVGASEGRGLGGLPQGRVDLAALLDTLREQETLRGLPLMIYGHSSGGYAAAATLASDEPPDGVVCVCAFDSPETTMLYHARRLIGPLADIQSPFMRLQNRLLFGPLANLSAKEAIDAGHTPVLIMEGAHDQAAPYAIGLAQYAADYRNPLVSCLTVDDPLRDAHTTLWLSGRAAAYVTAYTGDGTPDKKLANELDSGYMAQVLAFFENAADGS